MDPSELQRAIPGCQAIITMGENEYQLELAVGVGSVKGVFLGNIAIRNMNPPISYEMEVDSTGKAGFVRGVGYIRLEPDGDQTRVIYEGNVQVGGAIASVGQRMIQAVSKKLSNDFFEALKSSL